MEEEKVRIRHFIQDLNSHPIVHDWNFSFSPSDTSRKSVNVKPSIFYIKELQSKKSYSLNSDLFQTVYDIKKRLFELTHIPIEEQRLVINGRSLKDSQTMDDLIQQFNMEMIYLTRIRSKPSVTDLKESSKLPEDISLSQCLSSTPQGTFFEEFSQFLIHKYGQEQGIKLITSFEKEYHNFINYVKHEQ
jgi:hypothetical protein